MKFQRLIFSLTPLTMIAALAACGGGSSKTTTPPPPVIAIAATSGSGQSAVVGAAFAAPLVATVTTGGTPTSGATVTFAAPASGASGTFAGGANTATTNSSGVATSAVFTANTTAGPYAVTASVSGAAMAASFSLTNTAAAAPIAVSLGPSPTSLQVSTGGGITAFVANDAANAGVTWSCAPAGACGAFSAATTASGVATDFTAPATIPGTNPITLTATSVTDTTKSATLTLTVTAANAAPLADGNYVFSLAGEDTTTNGTSPFYYVSGVFTVSGGVIANGEQDYVDAFIYAPQDTITGGTVTTTGDGNLQIILDTNDTTVGANGIETLNATLVSGTRARIIEFDGNATASGRMDAQTSTAAPTGGYAFFAGGLDTSSVPIAIGGVINIDGSGTISGSGSVFDANEQSSSTATTSFSSQTFSASTVSAPDALGRLVFTLNPTDTTDFPQINLVGYVVDTSHIRLVEEETSNTSFLGTMAGVALGQGSNAGSFTSISGNSYVAELGGSDVSGAILQAVGVLTANSDGSVGGAINYNDLSGIGPTTPSPISGGTYTLDPTGRVTMTGVTDGIETFNLQLYLTGNGLEGETTAITLDANDVLAGLGFQQTGGGSFTASSMFGTYVLNATGAAAATNEPEIDAVGPITADGIGSWSGTADLNYFSVSQTAPVTVTGTFSPNANGAFTGTITGLDVLTSTNADTFSYYLIDTTKVFAIETDTNQLSLGFFTLEQ